MRGGGVHHGVHAAQGFEAASGRLRGGGETLMSVKGRNGAIDGEPIEDAGRGAYGTSLGLTACRPQGA